MANNIPTDARLWEFYIAGSTGSTHTFAPGNLTAVDGLPGTRELIDTSKIGDSGRTFTRSIWNATFVLEGHYDATASTGVHVIFEGLLNMTTSTKFRSAPTGTASGQTPVNREINGDCWIRSYTITGRVGNAVTFRAEGQVEGVPLFAASSDYAL